jgi:hypothetical protein
MRSKAVGRNGLRPNTQQKKSDPSVFKEDLLVMEETMLFDSLYQRP